MLEARGAEPADLLRALLTEALFEFDVAGFLAAAAEVSLEEPDRARAVLVGANRWTAPATTSSSRSRR